MVRGVRVQTGRKGVYKLSQSRATAVNVEETLKDGEDALDSEEIEEEAEAEEGATFDLRIMNPMTAAQHREMQALAQVARERKEAAAKAEVQALDEESEGEEGDKAKDQDGGGNCSSESESESASATSSGDEGPKKKKPKVGDAKLM
eukprot:5046975-Pyramimonas_sp.AAC.1